MRVPRPAGAVLLFLLILGCGPSEPAVFPASGRVIFRTGKPVSGGVVEFAPADGGPAARGKVDADGRFTLTTGDRPGAVAGGHRVAVRQAVVADGAAAHVKAHHATLVVHPKYGRFETSGLTAEVKTDGPNEFLLEVQAADEKRGW